MLTIDAEVQVMSAQVGRPTQESLDAGTTPHVELGIVSGVPLPIPHPATGQPIMIPVFQLRYKFSREQAMEVFGGALKTAESLPDAAPASSNVMVAQSMADVAQAAENMKRVTGR